MSLARQDSVLQEDKQQEMESLLTRSGSKCWRSARGNDDDDGGNGDDDRKPE